MAVARAMRGGLAALAVLLAVLGAVRAGTARADADPASDTLLVQDAFYPYSPATPPALQQALGTALKEIRVSGTKLDVAIIGSPVDLGGIPALFGHVEQYTHFLDTEISFKGPQPLLVVMPDGVAVADVSPASAVNGLTVDRSGGSAGLARTALTAVEQIAAAEGHPITHPTVASSGGGSPLPIALAAAAVLLLAGVITARTVRRRGARMTPALR